ncbi:MAG TPA: 3-dehydroquinate synthase [Gammaproteobacteria bacterium]
MQTLTVELGNRSYPIYIGEQLLSRPELLRRHITGRKVLVVSNETVLPLLRSSIEQALEEYDYRLLALPDGEQHKTLASLNLIYTELLNNGYDRHCTLIALGGGVVGDITGFAAATYQRGVHFIQIPTTLLAQVDSSVGGKTGVNHELGKNMIGAFYQPRCVLADISVLRTLPPRELSAGLAEVIKYGLIHMDDFFEWLETNYSRLLNLDPQAMSVAIEKSCRCKAEIVAADEHEQGVRALLNLGHTFGHAIETFVKYQGWLHGEAVGVGMLLAAEFSQRCGYLSGKDVGRIKALLENVHLPVKTPAGMGAADFLQLMARDKKVKDGAIRLVLLERIGHAIISDNYSGAALKEYLECLQQTR